MFSHLITIFWIFTSRKIAKIPNKSNIFPDFKSALTTFKHRNPLITELISKICGTYRNETIILS